MAKRYIVSDVRTKSDTSLRTIREPWLVIDTQTNKIVDEYHSGRAARMHAAQLNRGWPVPKRQTKRQQEVAHMLAVESYSDHARIAREARDMAKEKPDG